MFFGPSVVQLRSKINKKAFPGGSNIKQKIGQHLDPIFDWFLEPSWVDFGTVLATKLEPSWSQMLPKPNTKSNQKNYHFLEALRNDFGWILASKLVPKKRGRRGVERTFGALVGSWGQK